MNFLLGKHPSLAEARLKVLLAVFLVGIALAALTSCGFGGSSAAIQAPAALHGSVSGGQQPVSGAEVQLYAAGTSGAASPAVPLLGNPAKSDKYGNFLIPPSYVCPSASSQVYVVARGGNPGLASGADNPAIALTAMLGACSNLSSATQVSVNEVTTIGSIWPLAAYMTSPANLGSPAGETAFSAAAASVNEFVNLAQGVSPGISTSDSYFAQNDKLYSLADALDKCVNSPGGQAGDGSPCGVLFSTATSSGGVAPRDTMTAAMHIAQNPFKDVNDIFGMAATPAAFQPFLTAAPSDWTLTLSHSIATPRISLPTGTYVGGQTVSIADATTGSKIHYTTDGTVPTASSALYSAPISINVTSTVQAIAIVGSLWSSTASSTLTITPAPVPQPPAKLAFVQQPTNALLGAVISPAVSVAVEDASGAILTTATNRVQLNLTGVYGLAGTVQSTAVKGIATFSNLIVNTAGASYTLAAASPGLASAISTPFAIAASLAGAAAKLAFVQQPTNVLVGATISPAVQVAVQDSNGNTVTTASNQITLALAGGSNLIGTLTLTPQNGLATFNNLSVNDSGMGYTLSAISPNLTSATSPGFAVSTAPGGALPNGSSFTPPSANACQSAYDQFYIAEPGVYAYWALCEPGTNPAIYDYAGRFDFSPVSNAWSSGSGTIRGGALGPVADGETATQVGTGASFITNQDMPLNTNQGTLAIWTNTDSTNYPASMIYLGAVSGQSNVSISAIAQSSSECFIGTFTNSAGTAVTTPAACGYAPNTWRRVAFTWSNGVLALYVGGVNVANAAYSGSLDNKVFYYRLFPQIGDTGKQMTLAKASVANQAWTAVQVAADYKPALVTAPVGGMYVSTQKLGTIHHDVLGYADGNADISTSGLVSSLTTGLSSMGAASIRYAGGYSGIAADLADWRGGASCGTTPGLTVPAANVSTSNSIDNYVTQVAKPLGASLGYTVNYGTNPPACNAGGDPTVNGADLVAYANVTKKYGIKYWEIGNELYNGEPGGTETDYHPSPANGTSYGTYETQFYSQMKATDPNILIGIPVADGVYSWLADWTLPAMQSATYDAVVFHSYPMNDPITDGQTLYPERVTSNMNRVRGSLLALQTELLNVKKAPDAIWITEWSSNVNGDKWSRQSMGAAMPMFTMTELAEYLQAGVQYATWYAQGMSDACYQYNYDWNGETAYNWWDCGSAFLTYTGSLSGEVAVGLKPGDLSPAARAFQMLSQSGFVTEGEHMLRVTTDAASAPWLSAYAATHGSAYEVILINRDRDASHSVPIQVAGKTAGVSIQQWSYGRAQYDQAKNGIWSAPIVTSTQSNWSGQPIVSLPPWSINVVLVQ